MKQEININDQIFLTKKFIRINNGYEHTEVIYPLSKVIINKSRQQYEGVSSFHKRTTYYKYLIMFRCQGISNINIYFESEEKRDEVFDNLFNNLP